ncbi:MAG TPA: hypothetical protein VG778_09410, partial [Blastocatellia bacterium]|nr:hypothetical protein [Blastocatellia bacterium]
MSGLSFSPDPSPSLPNKPLNSAEVGVELVGGTVGYEVEPELGVIRFSLAASGNASISAFNSPDDEDPDGVLGLPVKEETPLGSGILPPQVQLSGERAWVKFRFSARAEAGAGIEV